MSLQTPEDATIAEMWKNALAEFEKLVPDKGFKNLALTTTPEDLRKKIEDLNSEADAKKNSKAGRAKDIGLKVVEVVKTFGAVAAETAGMVFGPAQVCYGALSIFLSIPRKVRDFHEFIEQVFIELDPVLAQFDMFIKMEKDHTIHESLQTAIHKVMASFIHLCGTVISIQQGGKWERFKRHTVQILSDDKDLQEELDKFRRIVNGLQGIQDTATYEGVLDTRAGVIEIQRNVDGVGSNVKKLVEEQNKRTRDDKKKIWLEDVRKSLGIKEDDINNPKGRHEKMKSNRLRGTGNWLLKDERFKKWAENHAADSDTILFLTGPSGFGKSTLLSAVIDQLKSQASALGQDRRSLVSYHFLPTQVDKMLDHDDLAETALKWVAVQLAEQDDLLCKNIAAAVTTRVDELKTAGVAGLWDVLKLKSSSARTTNYLIFDDFDKFSESARQQFAKIVAEVTDLSEGHHSSIKMLVAGDFDPEELGFEASENKTITIKVDVESMREDFQFYISERLRQKNMLPGPKCAELRQRLQDALLETPGCSFRIIDIAMKNIERVIASAGKEAELFQAIARSTQDEDDVIKESIAQLQDDLMPVQINLINSILVWLIFGYEEYMSGQFRLTTLEAGLRTLGVELPIEGLANFITSKAQGLMHIAGETVILEEGARKAVVKPRAVPRLAEPPRINLEIKIVNADLPTARRFFWDLAKHVTLDQFDFSSNSPNAQTGDIKGIITVNDVDAHLTMVQATLDLFSNPSAAEEDDLVELGYHLLTRFTDNLQVLYDAADLDAIDDETKRKVGKFVYNLFANPRLIVTYWKIFQYKNWSLYSGDALAEYWRWLEDKTATSGLGTRDEEWLKKCVASEDKSRELLTDVMKEIARHWLLSSKHHYMALYWIDDFFSEIWKMTNVSGKGYTFDPKEGIEKAEAWCREQLGISEAEIQPIWYENLALAYERYGLYKEAITHYEKSAALVAPEPASWATMLGLADASLSSASKKEDQRKAFAIKEQALEVYLGPKGSEVSIDDKVRELENSAGWSIFFEDKEKALKYRQKAFDLAPNKPETQYSLLRHHIVARQHSEAQAVFQTILVAEPTTDDESDARPGRAGGLVRAIVEDVMTRSFYPTYWLIVSAATDAGVLSQLLEGFDEAIEEVKIKNASDISQSTLHPMLVLHQGLLHFYDKKSDPSEIKTGLGIFAEAVAVAQDYHASANTLDDFFEMMSCVRGKYYFDESLKIRQAIDRQPSTEREALGQQFGAQLTQVVAEYEKAVPNGEITGGKCFLATSLTLQGNQKGARNLFKSDMVQVINMLSDDEQSNDTWALRKLRRILMHSGEIEDAFVAFYLTSIPSIGDKVPGMMREALEQLLLRTTQTDQAMEGSPAARLLAMFDEERAAETDQTVASIIEKLVAEAARHLPGARKTVPEQTEAAVTESQEDDAQQPSSDDSPAEEPAKESAEVSVEESAEEPAEESVEKPAEEELTLDSETQKAWIEVHKALRLISDQNLLGYDGSGRWCNNCEGYLDNEWGFEKEIYACKYCDNMDLCETCLQEIKAADPEKIHPVCHPLHDWLRLPVWTLDNWVDAVRMIVRLPTRNEEGNLVPGDETMDMTDWLNKVTEPWGGLAAGKTWDHVKSPPPVVSESEAGSESGSEKGEDDGEENGEESGDEGEDGKKDKTTNGEVNGENHDDTSGEEDEESSSTEGRE